LQTPQPTLAVVGTVVLKKIRDILDEVPWDRIPETFKKEWMRLREEVYHALKRSEDAQASFMARWASNPHLAGKMPIAGARSTARNRAVAIEVELIRKRGSGSFAWTPAEVAQIKRTGRLPAGVEAHHINDVERFPDWQGDPKNIKFVRGRAGNLAEHGGHYQNSTTGPLIDRQALIDATN
jgi:GHH signature containing HNH/Endo VII superfamily nuclease toxin